MPPLNLVGDYGGGGMLLAFGILAALYERAGSGEGQVIDAAMVDGASLLMSIFHGTLASGGWQAGRGINLLDGGAPFYRTYATADGEYVAVGCIERKFYRTFLTILGLAAELPCDEQHNRACWPETARRIAQRFQSATRAEWLDRFAGSDACVTPVLALDEVYAHPHARARGAFHPMPEGMQPAPAPRFSRSRPAAPRQPRERGEDARAILAELGFDADEIEALHVAGAHSSEAERPASHARR